MSPNGNAERDAEERQRRERDPRDEEQCNSRRSVQMGPMAAVDLRCVLLRWQHDEPLHMTTRDFGTDVRMVARWPGEFEEPEPT